MNSKIKPRHKLSRKELVSLILRELALKLNPKNGHLVVLAAAIKVHPVTLSVWIKQGYVPEDGVRKLRKKFGEETVSMDELCPVQFRL